MYDSVRSWVTVPYSYKPFVKRDGAGTPEYGEIVSSACYPVGKLEIVTNASGAEVISTTQLYVAGEEPIKVTDAVIFEGDVRPIHKINSFYRNGRVDIKVVYL